MCGTKIEETKKICNYCKHENDDDANYCVSCGNKL